MEKNNIIELIEKNYDYSNLEKTKNILAADYEISYGDYSTDELKKAIEKKSSPVIVKNNLIVGIDKDNKFITDKKEKVNIRSMTKAIIIEDKRDDFQSVQSGDNFFIIGRNEWANDISYDFNSILGNLRIGEIFLPPHSSIVNFLNPGEKEEKEKIVSSLLGVNINIYNPDNYIDNTIHEIGHLFWRTCLINNEREQFKNYFKGLNPSAIYEYEWEHSNPEEVFCTIYKWYVKSILINKSFYNILEHEEPKGLKLLQNVFDRIRKNKITSDIWELNKDAIHNYINPKLDLTTGNKIVKKGALEEIQNIELPEEVLYNINKFQGGKIFINLEKANVPVKGNKIDFFFKLEKADKKQKAIYMDMDGVIADFSKRYKELFNRDAKTDDAFTVKSFINQEPSFFRNLPVLPQGMELFNALKNDYKVVFLTTPMEGIKTCCLDKIEWVKENLGEYDIIFSDNKADHVIDNESILIDDMDYNLEPWKEAGGTAIRFPQKIDKILSIIEKTFNPDEEAIKIKRQLKNMIVNTEPTEAQKKSGIYKKGTINFKGLIIKVENPKGSIRFGLDEYGKKWVNRMKCHYGYITGTEGADYDPVDCFIGPHLNKSLAFVINQGREGIFDEHKIMLGFETIEEAEKAYLSNYQKGWTGLQSIKQTNTKKLRDWLSNGNMKEPY